MRKVRPVGYRIERRLPIDPLIDKARGDRPMHDADHCPCLETTPYGHTNRFYCYSIEEFGRALGVAPETVHRWRKAGGFDIEDADDYAVLFGLLPEEVWGSAWADWMDARVALLDDEGSELVDA